MTDSDDLLDDLRTEARSHVRLALLAEAEPVAGMHLDLAIFRQQQAAVAEELCAEY